MTAKVNLIFCYARVRKAWPFGKCFAHFSDEKYTQTSVGIIFNSLRTVLAYKACIAPTLFIKVPVSKKSQGREQSRICVLEVSIFCLSSIFLLDFVTVPTVWYFFVFNFMHNKKNNARFSENLHQVRTAHTQKIGRPNNLSLLGKLLYCDILDFNTSRTHCIPASSSSRDR